MKFKREKFVDVIDEALPLIENHFKEVDAHTDLGLDIDRIRYADLDDMGSLRVFTVRTPENVLAGYACFIVNYNLHYKTRLCAIQDVLYVAPEHRGFGYLFIERCDQALKSEGVELVLQSVTVKHDFSRSLIRLGYKEQETLYAKRL